MFGLELGFHKVDEGNEKHSRWREYGNIKCIKYVCFVNLRVLFYFIFWGG